MTWAKILCLFLMMGCTIKVEPLPQRKPVKRAQHHRHTKSLRVSPTPTPVQIRENRPMQLEPTDKPTPIIHIPPQLGTVNLTTSYDILSF